MPSNPRTEVLQHLCRTALLRDSAGLTDRQLLESHLSGREETALAALVHRHGPMVWSVCRRILAGDQDAEDAFQATFLVLVRKAAAIASRELLANWLYGVARQTALKARAVAARRKERERQVTDMAEPAVADHERWHDLQPLLDEELGRLPDKYRAVLVLCDLEGQTRKEAARQLGCPEGTVAGRLARARVMLAKRLARRGVALSGGVLAALLSQKAAAVVPAAVVHATIAASLVAAGRSAAAEAISAEVAALTEGVLKAMLLNKLKIIAAVVLVLLAGLTAGGLLHRTQAAGPTSPGQTQAAAPAAQGETQTPKQAEKDRSEKVLSGREVVSIFRENEAASDEKLVGKKLRVTGKVFQVQRVAIVESTFIRPASLSPKQCYLLTLSAEAQEAKKPNKAGSPATLPLQFAFPLGERKQLAELKRGQTVTIEGVCDGVNRDKITFSSCKLLKTGRPGE